LILWALGPWEGGRIAVCTGGYRIWGIQGVQSTEMPLMGFVFGDIERTKDRKPRKRLVSRGIMRRKLNENQRCMRTLRQYCRRRECCPWQIVFWEIRLKDC
jgi:hypothetical protein